MRSRPPFPAWLPAVLSVVGLVLPLGGCGLFEDQPRPTTTTQPSAATTTTEPGTTVLDAGAAPRRALRLRFTPGDTATITLTLDYGVTQRAGGRTQELQSPVVTETVRLTVDRVEGDVADVSFTFTDVSLDAKGLSDAEFLTLTAETRKLIGLRGTARLDDRGGVTDFAYEQPDGIDPDVAATLRQFQDQVGALTVPLPAEAVGVGARWQTTTATELSGISVDQRTTYEITAIDGDTVRYEATIAQSAEPQDVDLPTLPTGTTARLISSKLTGTATGELDLAGIVAATTSSLEGTQVIELTGAGDAPVRLSQDLHLSTAVRPAG